MVILMCPTWLASAQFGFIYFYKMSFQHLGILEKIEYSSPALGATLSIVFVQRFLEESPKFSTNFLIVYV